MKYIIFFILILIISGCIDSVFHLKGKVISNLTGEPIVNAKIKCGEIIVFTDSLGYFELVYSGGLLSQKDFFITKNGYKDFQMGINYKESQTIYKVNNEISYYDLKNGKHICPDTVNLYNTWLASISFDKYSRDFSIKKDILIVYLDIDRGIEGEFKNYLEKNKNHKFRIIK